MAGEPVLPAWTRMLRVMVDGPPSRKLADCEPLISPTRIAEAELPTGPLVLGATSPAAMSTPVAPTVTTPELILPTPTVTALLNVTLPAWFLVMLPAVVIAAPLKL